MREAAPTYLAVLLGPGATGNLATPDPFLNDRVSFRGWEPTLPEARLRNEHGTKGDEKKKKKNLVASLPEPTVDGEIL